MTLHDIEDLKRHLTDELAKAERKRRADYDNIMSILKPISETYNTATTLGKWVKAALLITSVTIGIIVGWRNIFNPRV